MFLDAVDSPECLARIRPIPYFHPLEAADNPVLDEEKAYWTPRRSSAEWRRMDCQLRY
jgi:hypothetical protein